MVTDSADRRMENINKYTEFQMSRWTWTCDLHMLDARLTLVLVWCIQSYNLLQMMSTALEWCIVTVLCSFHACIQKYRNVGPISSVNETRKKCRLFVASSFSNTLTEQKKKQKTFGAEKHFNCTLGTLGLWLCRHWIENRLVRFDACDEFCLRRLQIIHVQYFMYTCIVYALRYMHTKTIPIYFSRAAKLRNENFKYWEHLVGTCFSFLVQYA